MKINREMHDLRRAIAHEGEVLESFASKTRDKAAALTFLRKPMKHHGRARAIRTNDLRPARPTSITSVTPTNGSSATLT